MVVLPVPARASTASTPCPLRAIARSAAAWSLVRANGNRRRAASTVPSSTTPAPSLRRARALSTIFLRERFAAPARVDLIAGGGGYVMREPVAQRRADHVTRLVDRRALRDDRGNLAHSRQGPPVAGVVELDVEGQLLAHCRNGTRPTRHQPIASRARDAAGTHRAVAQVGGLGEIVGGQGLGLAGGQGAVDEIPPAAAVERDVDQAQPVAALLAPHAPLGAG